MTNLPLVSVCIPTYNRPELLKRALNCTVNQTYTNLEIIVSDNCSSNLDVKKVMDLFANDSRLKFFQQITNMGAVYNYHYVISKANGDYILNLADDDWFDLNYIESCVHFLENNPDYSSAYGSARIYNFQNEFADNYSSINMEQNSPKERMGSYYNETVYNDAFYGLMRKENYIALVVKNKLGGDWLIVARIAFLGKYKILDNTHCYISLGGASQSFESLVRTLKLRGYVKYFPYLEVCKNILLDIIFDSPIYQSLNIFSRIRLGFACTKIVWKRFKVKKEITKGITILNNLMFAKIKNKSNSLINCLRILINKLYSFRNRQLLQKKFTTIFKNNSFVGTDSISGPGSDLIQTKIIRNELPKIIEKYVVKTFIDAPCGDFYWMQYVSMENVYYIGLDIVSPIIKKNTELYANNKRTFLCKNIITDKLIDADIILIRDCWVHLSNTDIFNCVKNLKRSNIKYLLTTSFPNLAVNVELTAIWRPINLQINPFYFPKPLEVINENCTEDEGIYSDKSLILWEISNLP
jgi:glycosyltransferase domain-containing protein